jgi:hypothetical protein
LILSRSRCSAFFDGPTGRDRLPQRGTQQVRTRLLLAQIDHTRLVSIDRQKPGAEWLPSLTTRDIVMQCGSALQGLYLMIAGKLPGYEAAKGRQI